MGHGGGPGIGTHSGAILITDRQVHDIPKTAKELPFKGPLHGIQMIRAMEEMSGGTWKPSPGSVYPVLKRLEENELIAGKLERSRAAPRRVYRLTAKGRSALPKMQGQLLRAHSLLTLA
mgnify:CR=1 FL=1